jgi:hypothetical protein
MRFQSSTRYCGDCGQQLRPWHFRYCSEACYSAVVHAADVARFWSKVDTSGDCWLWTAGTTAKGYGVFGTGSKRDGTATHVIATRFVWQLTHGPIPPGLLVCHSCDTPACVNPTHLYLGTAAENSAAMVSRGRHLEGNLRAARKRRGEANPNSRLTTEQARRIREVYRTGMATSALARQYGVSRQVIWRVGTGRDWPDV